MRALLNGQFPNFYQLAGGITVDVALRYFFLVGIAWLLGYVLFRRRWFHRKIVAAFPMSGEVRREIGYSLLSIFIFGLIGAATITAARHGWTQFYWGINDHGWGWFGLSIVCAIFLHDTYFYWTHRLMDSWLRRILNTPTNHIMHHEKLRGNYGLYFNIWDRLMDTNHEEYEKRFREVTSRNAGNDASAAAEAPVEHRA